jgi:hypothetical protein
LYYRDTQRTSIAEGIWRVDGSVQEKKHPVVYDPARKSYV